ncbi:MAG: AAA family ATPase [Candidatus Riflebacteria bacterium]|nr:AAA family ATPase [Candidatus Riflebacteria bacterium]
MKIMNVRFANINSLKGDFEIDFTHPEIAGRGIFAIMGQTGSGKTTILDAVTLALFGKTPRLATLSASENELMTRGTGFCHAEVTFEAIVEDRVLVFRSIWEQRRARNLPTGSLQPAKMQLVQLNDRRPSDEYESSKLSEVPKKVDDITGLNFERFTRTCLLAQGQFAAFLDAKPNDRAQILEQITGTGIYLELSRKAWDRDKEALAKVDTLRNEMQGITIITDDEFSILRQKVESLSREKEACDAQKQTLQQHIAWIKNLNTLLLNQQTLIEQQRNLTMDRESHAAEFNALAYGRKAEPARAPLAQRDSLMEKRRKRENELNETRIQLPLAQQTLADIQKQLEKAKNDRTDFQKVVEREQILIREARACDQHIKGLAENHVGISLQHDSTLKQLADAEAQFQMLGKNIADLHQVQKNIGASIEEAAIDKALGSDLKALETLAAQHQDISRQLAAAIGEFESSKKEIIQAQNELKKFDSTVKKAVEDVLEQTKKLSNAEKIISERFPGVTVKGLQEGIKQTQKRDTAARSLQALGNEMRELAVENAQAAKAISERTKEINAAEKVFAELKKEHEKLEVSIEELSAKKIHFQTVASLEEHRQQLEEGRPCPLCGALDHPYAKGKKDSADLKEIDGHLKKEKAHLKKVLESIAETQKAISRLTAEQAADESTIKNHGKAASDLRKKWDTLAKGFDQVLACENIDQLELLVDAAAKACKAAETAVEDFQTAGEVRDKAEKAVGRTKEKRQNLETEQATAQGTLIKAQALEQKAGQHKAELEQQRVSIGSRLRNDLYTFGFSDFDDEVLPKLKLRWEAYQDLQRKLDRAIQDEQKSQQKLASATTQRDNLSRQLTERREALAKAEADLTAARSSRINIYGTRNPDVEEKKLQTSLAEHQTRENSAVGKTQDCQLRLENLRTTEKNMAADLETLTTEVSEVMKALDTVRQDGGFPDEISLRAALLPSDELKRLSDLEKYFDTKTAQLHGQVEGLKKQIADHETQRPTNQTLDELIRAEIVQVEKSSLALTAWQEQWKIMTTHQENREKHVTLSARIQTAQKEGERWSKLNMLIGSAGGDKFQKFAQGLTFSSLVYQANQQLQKLTDRYLLANEALELQIIDRYIADARASARNLSGGEKFLASLALALGLAHMVSHKYRMDTLFIDEGFGALDPQTLETAIAVLCGLQQQGKLIGVISHVESLKERLPVRLEVVRLGGGLSTISGPGCTKHSPSSAPKNTL